MPPELPGPIPIHKSKSCPIGFSSDRIDLMPLTSTSTTPPVSNGSAFPRRKISSNSYNYNDTRFVHGLNGNGTSTISMDLSRTPSASSTGNLQEQAVPGRPRRRGNRTSFTTNVSKTKKDPAQSIRYRFMTSKWMKNPMRGETTTSNSYLSLIVAVMLWYSLGVISITTSNLLMMKPKNHVGGVPPLFLTLQQLVIGTIVLRGLLNIGFLGSRGIQPWPTASGAAQAAAESRRKNLLFNNMNPTNNSSLFSDFSSNLVLAGLCFAMGFLATNSGFLSSSAAFVETVKAAEPITSAAVAVLWKIETLSGPEGLSLGCIVVGVLISTLAHGATSSSSSVGSTLIASLQSCVVVMTANLCFSFRGLYQKLFRASPEGAAQVIDDLNLQLRMQQIGVLLLIVPVVMFDLREMALGLWVISREVGLIGSGVAIRYIVMALINGIAFTGYNLASTYILTRISVVHHAALNCIRRIFAIIVTSIYFRIPVTSMGIVGFFVSFGGFMAFTHYKIQREKQPKPLSSLLPVSAATSDKPS